VRLFLRDAAILSEAFLAASADCLAASAALRPFSADFAAVCASAILACAAVCRDS